MAQCGGNPSRYAATKPTEKDLKVVADRAGGNWSRLLTSLDIPWATIQSIKAESSTNLWEACMNGLVIWLKGGVSDSNEPVTFGTLFAALKDSGMADCVSLLVDRLDERSTPHPRPTHEDKDKDPSTPPSKRRKMEQKLGAAEQELVRAMLAAEGLGAELEAARRRAQEQGECSSELAAVRIQLEQTRKEGVDVVDVLMTEKRSLQSEVQSCQERIDRWAAEGMAGAEDTAALQRRLKESEEMLQELEKDTVTQLQEKDTVTQLQEKDTQLQEKDTLLQEKGALIAKLLEKIQRLEQNKPPRNWKELKCQKTLECGGYCRSIAVQGDVVCVGVEGRVLLFSKTSGAQVSELGSDQIKGRVYGVAVIDEDTIVVSADKRLRMYTTKGQLVRTFDSGKDGFFPCGLTVGPDGSIFLCDNGNDCVCVFNVDGKLLSSFGSEGSGVGHFNHPWDVCMDGEGLLFISDRDNARICVHSVEGAFIREFPTPIGRVPWCGVAATHCNHLVVSSFPHTVMIMTTSGQLVHEFGGEGRGPGQFSWPHGVAVDNEDCVYVCDLSNKRVQVY